MGTNEPDSLALIAEAYGQPVKMLGWDEYGYRVRVGRRILSIRTTGSGEEIAEVRWAGKGRPNELERSTIQRQYVECVRQLADLKRALRIADADRNPARRLSKALQGAEGEMPKRAPARFWLQPLKLGVITEHEIRIAEASRAACLQFETASGTVVKGSQDTNASLLVLYQHQAIEYAEPFLSGDWSLSAMSQRILTIFNGLDFDFLKRPDEHDLFIRKFVYPLPAELREQLRALQRT